MTKFILHGGYTREPNELNRTFFTELAKDVPNNGTILLVYFASTDDNIDTRFEEHRKMILENITPNTVTVLLANEKDFIHQVNIADAIFLNGGNTDKLLKTLENYPDFKNEIEGKTIAGSSAGAYTLARYGASHSLKEMRRGLGIVPIRLICHFESETLPPSKTSVEMLIGTSPELELVTLKDYEWRTFHKN
ncbi:hypothetical protein EPO56_03775 [Patescibacteria group bacterium]|nr:MAG: hypothetical protein EPO56_03775 [Patescibacteria group bacterium]